jgi:hypothetical protein
MRPVGSGQERQTIEWDGRGFRRQDAASSGYVRRMATHQEDADHPERDAAWDERARHETPTQRLDRNWADLLQELRVVQTGVQLLTGFLLTLPFQARFEKLSTFQQDVYLITVASSVVATGLVIAPVSLHRILFRQRARRRMVSVAHRLALSGLIALSLAIIGVVLLIFDVVKGAVAGWIAAGVVAGLLIVLWFAFPLAIRATDDSSDEQQARR